MSRVPAPVTPGNSWEAFQQARLPSRIQWCEEAIGLLQEQLDRLIVIVEAQQKTIAELTQKLETLKQ